VAAYIASASDWTPAGIERIGRTLSSDLFIEDWVPYPLPSGVWGFFQGSMYKHGSGVYDILDTYFTCETIGRDEIWTGTYNREKKIARFFCNRRTNIAVDLKLIDKSLLQCEFTLLERDMKTAAKACTASAAIPSYVPAVEIEGQFYSDGGLYYASPLSVMQEAFLKEPALHIIYVNSIDLGEQRCNGHCHQNLVENGREAAMDLVRGQIVSDRYAGYNCLRRHADEKIHYREIVGTAENIGAYLSQSKKCQRSMLELFPGTYREVDITTFDGADIVRIMRQTEADCWGRIWWVGDAGLFANLASLGPTGAMLGSLAKRRSNLSSEPVVVDVITAEDIPAEISDSKTI